MTKKKKQHYVPKFYLRLFSLGGFGYHIKIFRKEKGDIIARGALKNQAYGNYLYGKNPEIEDAFSEIESKVSGIIKDMMSSKTLPVKHNESYRSLWLFTLLQAYRTKGKAQELNEMVDKSMKSIMKHDSRFKDYNFDEFFIGYKDPAVMNLDVLIRTMHVMLDMEMKLIINKTNLPFITSDSPVFKYNQFLERRKHPFSHTGMASKGLQVFYPLSPNFMLILYDPKVYKVGFKKQRTVELNLNDDITALNLLQFLNSDDVVFTNEQTKDFYLETLFEQSKKYKGKGKMDFKEYDEKLEPDGSTSILMHHQKESIKTNLKLSFIKETPHAKYYKMTGYVAELRDERLRNRDNRQMNFN